MHTILNSSARQIDVHHTTGELTKLRLPWRLVSRARRTFPPEAAKSSSGPRDYLEMTRLTLKTALSFLLLHVFVEVGTLYCMQHFYIEILLLVVYSITKKMIMHAVISTFNCVLKCRPTCVACALRNVKEFGSIVSRVYNYTEESIERTYSIA